MYNKIKTLIVVQVSMAIVAATVIGTISGTRQGVKMVGEEDGDPLLDEEVGDQLNEDGGQDQLQVLFQPTKLRLLPLNSDQLHPLLLPDGWIMMLILFKRKNLFSSIWFLHR